MKDPSGLFNASLGGKVRRAIDIHEGDEIVDKYMTFGLTEKANFVREEGAPDQRRTRQPANAGTGAGCTIAPVC